MPLNPAFSPFFLEFSGFIDKEGTSLYSDHFSAVHIFFFDYFEQAAGFLVGVREKVKGKVIFRLKLFMRGQCISRNTQHNRVASLEFQIICFEVATFVRTSRSAVFRIEVDDDILSAQRLQFH